MAIAKRVLITGRVQGVGYRYATREQAQALGLVGWVRNLTDGRVEAVVQGDRDTVQTLLQWFHNGGPPAARVDTVQTESKSTEALTQFEIRR